MSSNCKGELRCINCMLHDTKLYNYLKTLLINYNDSLLDNVLKIVNTPDTKISNKDILDITNKIKDKIRSLIEDVKF